MAEERQHEDAATEEEGMRWRELGSFAPRIPPGPSGVGSVDLGAGGSLLAQVRRARGQRRAAGPRPLSRPYLVVAVGVAAVALGVVVAVVFGGLAVGVGAGLVAVGAATAAVGGWVLRGESRMGVELVAQARRERQLARELDTLAASGWWVLHDRVLPGGHHRVPHVAVGPAGVFVVTPLPAGPLRLAGAVPGPGSVDERQLYAGPVHLPPWLRARRWEIEQLEPALVAAFEDVVWAGPTTPLVVQVPSGGGGQAGAGLPDMPPDWGGVTFRPLSAVSATLRGLPSPLSASTVAELAATVQRLCPPAGPGLDQESSNKRS